jgi:hypothetical protein
MGCDAPDAIFDGCANRGRVTGTRRQRRETFWMDAYFILRTRSRFRGGETGGLDGTT